MLKIKRIFSNLLGSSESKAVISGDQFEWLVDIDRDSQGVARISVLPDGALFVFGRKMPEGKFSGEPERLLRFSVSGNGDVLTVSGLMTYGFEDDCNGLVSIFYSIINNHSFTKTSGD